MEKHAYQKIPKDIIEVIQDHMNPDHECNAEELFAGSMSSKTRAILFNTIWCGHWRENVFRDTRGESHIPQIPEHIRKEIARCLLPDIIAYFESEQGQREFAEWKAQQEAEKKEKSEVA